MQSIDLNAGGSASFAFETVGASITGKITNLEELQQTDLQTGQPKTFDNGQPMMMYRVELQTTERLDSDDDGIRSVYLKGSKKPESQSSLAAVLAAVRAATGRYNLTVGGTLTLTYIGDGVAKNRGFNAPKLYSAQYVAPSLDLGGDQAYQQPQQPTPAAYQQPQQPTPAAYQQPAQPVMGTTVHGTPAPAPEFAQPIQQQPATPAPAVPGLTPEVLAAMQAAGINPALLGQQG